MDTLLNAFLIQLVLCVLLFALIFYFVRENDELKKRIRSVSGQPGDRRDKS